MNCAILEYAGALTHYDYSPYAPVLRVSPLSFSHKILAYMSDIRFQFSVLLFSSVLCCKYYVILASSF